VPEAADADTLDLLRSTAREVFADGASLTDLGDLGLLGLLTPEAQGGAGWCVVEAVIVATEAGRALSEVPWIGSLLTAAALADADNDTELVAALLAGHSTGAFVERPGAVADDDSWQVTGRFVVAGTVDPAVVVFASPWGPLLAVDSGDDRVTFTAQPDAIDAGRGGQLMTVAGAPARLLATGERDTLADAAVLLACADTLGALAATAERVGGYLCDREAFGRPLAAFQVLQHRLADLDILVAESDALIEAAAIALAERSPDAHHLVEMARTFMSDRCTTALDDCIQLSGGIGVTWEWPVHFALRRSVTNASVRVGWAPSAEHLQAALDAQRPPLPGTEDFRRHVRSVIAEHRPPLAREGHRAPTSPEQEKELRAWWRTMFDTGLLGASWPPEWGGRADYESTQQIVVSEEVIRARVPRPIDQVMLASHVLLHFGTQEQKAQHLPAIRAAENIWCQLFSEPDAGSDLAGIKTRARQDADGNWVLNGQKTWTTDGHWAQFGLALVRTSKEESRHAGLTVFIVPMSAPGIEIRPIRMITEAHDINAVFLDDIVLGPENVVGEVGQGWKVAMSGLEVERFGVGGNIVLLEMLLRDVLAVARGINFDGVPLAEDAAVRTDINGLIAEFEAARAFSTGHVSRVLSGRAGEAEASIAKIAYTETYNRIARFGVQMVERFGPIGDPDMAQAAERLRDAWLWSRVLTISGGSSEVMRNIIAKRRLKLPSSSAR
jgi:alkylation response protein AidB-like acyl-CoA dehydrogenase